MERRSLGFDDIVKKYVSEVLLQLLCLLAVPQCESYNESVAEHLPERQIARSIRPVIVLCTLCFDAMVLSKVLYALSAWGGYISQSLKDRIDACFRKAYRWRLTSTQYKFDNLLFSIDSKLFARCK